MLVQRMNMIAMLASAGQLGLVPEKGAVAARRHAGEPLERVREVALIREARLRRDLRQRHVRTRQQLAGIKEATTPLILTDRAAEEKAKGRGEVHGMHTGFCGNGA